MGARALQCRCRAVAVEMDYVMDAFVFIVYRAMTRELVKKFGKSVGCHFGSG